MVFMLSSLWSARWYGLLGLLSLLVFLVLTVPLHFVWPYLKPELGRLPVSIQYVAGTIWNGQLQAKERQLGEIQLDWTVSPWSIFALAPAAELSLSNDQLNLEGEVKVSLDQVVELNNFQGYLDIELMKSALKRDRVEVAGELELSGLNAVWNQQEKSLGGLTGQLIFSGGPASFPMGRKITSVDVPLLVGQMHMEGDQAVLDIMDEAQLELGQAFLKPDGWGGVAIRRRFIDAVGQTWPQKANEDTIIFEVSRKIL